MFYDFVLLFIHQGIISKRLDLGDFILMGNWTITAVYGHQVCVRNVVIYREDSLRSERNGKFILPKCRVSRTLFNNMNNICFKFKEGYLS